MNSCIDVGQRALCNELDLEIKSLLTVLLYYCTTAWLYVCTTKGGAQLNNTSRTTTATATCEFRVSQFMEGER